MNYNNIQTDIKALALDKEAQEIQDNFWKYLNGVPFIQSLISENRPKAKDLLRDAGGKIIIDITKPHILEDMDFFRKTAIHYQQTGKLTDLRPNANYNSDFCKWLREEVSRCFYGYVRESDGEWITGDYYYFLNYCPILMAKKEQDIKSKKALRVIDFPSVWEGHYLLFHYLNIARESGHHAMELARRGAGKSYGGAALLAKRFILGESEKVNKLVQCVVTASEKKYLSGANQVLDMFQSYIDFCADNTQFPSKRLISAPRDLQWTMGYLDLNSGTKKGTLNSVVGITSKDDESKLRGSRGVLYLIEEMGSFPRLLSLYNILRPSVEDGENVFGTIFLYGTAGDDASDFSAAQEMMYNPKGYNIQSLPNVFDLVGQGKKDFTFFFPGYMNRANCYDANGNSDVIKALYEICKDRYITKYNSTDSNTVTKRISEIPITPQEAIIKSKGNMFPITDLTNRLNQIDSNPKFYDTTYIGNLVLKNNTVEFEISNAIPIRNFPLKDNKYEGAIEIWKMPEKDKSGSVFSDRYILGYDPVDDDESNTLSLTSCFVLDLFTDQIVAEYTGRLSTADACYEIVRRLCIFYNGKCLYESNKKGIYPYFNKYNCLYMLADTPPYLRDKSIIKDIGLGNKSKGVNATAAVNAYANNRIKDWLIKPYSYKEIDGDNVVELTTFNLYNINSRALIQELISFNPEINVDRVRALGMLMLYREEQLILGGGEYRSTSEEKDLNEDPYFVRNYKPHRKV